MTPDERQAMRERAEWILDDAPHRDSVNDAKVMARFALAADDERARADTIQQQTFRTLERAMENLQAAEARVAELERALKMAQHFNQENQRDLAAAEARVRRLEEALRKYGEHEHWCEREWTRGTEDWPASGCSCGLDAALQSEPAQDAAGAGEHATPEQVAAWKAIQASWPVGGSYGDDPDPEEPDPRPSCAEGEERHDEGFTPESIEAMRECLERWAPEAPLPAEERIQVTCVSCDNPMEDCACEFFHRSDD